MPLTKYFLEREIKLNSYQYEVAVQLSNKLEAQKKLKLFSSRKKSFYLWGEVGRGKTMLMDAYFCQLKKPALRVHYHQFFKDLYKNLKGSSNQKKELIQIAGQTAKKYKVICFDEFHLHDITNTVLIEVFLKVLIQKGIEIVLTSNYPPDNLLPDPVMHKHALPLIKIIYKNFTILNLMGKTDYRYWVAKNQTQRQTYFFPHSEDLILKIKKLTLKETNHQFNSSEIKFSMGSKVKAELKTNDSVWFMMKNICGGLYSHLDYLELAEVYQKLIILNIRQDDLNNASTLRRFIWLIDILYDQKIELFLSSEMDIFKMLSQIPDCEDLSRTTSRLNQMQSIDFYSSQSI